MIGDYAEDGDLRGREDMMGQKESGIYDAVTDEQSPLDKMRKRKNLKDLSRAFLPIYERVVGFHTNNMDPYGNLLEEPSRFSNFFPTKKTEAGWELDLSHEAEEDRSEVREYYERMGAFKKTGWQRPPLPIEPQYFKPLAEVPETIPSAEDGHGTPLLWVNLDRCEFVDPAAMGDVPDLAGVMTGDSSRSVLAMLVHYERRGGGDVSDLGPVEIAGRWRGDRIVLLGAEGFKPKKGKFITHEKVRKTFVDITENAGAFVNAGDNLDSESMLLQETEPRDRTQTEKDIFSVAMKSPTIQKYITNPSEGTISCRITHPVSILNPNLDAAKSKGPLNLAPSFDLYVSGGKVFLDAEIRKEINALLATLPTKRVRLTYDKQKHVCLVYCPGDVRTEISITSNHEIISAMMAAA
jgi:hypothetical protein